MKHRVRTILAGVLLLVAPTLVLACLWDSDTLKQERYAFPEVLELVTGKFLRHSKEFYEWRIKDRTEKLKEQPSNLGYHDDLAVAYEKAGQHEKAIETILAKEKIQPGLYETYSNLGTFHILAGDFEAGLPLIDKALAINPDAHFGREKYQKWLVEYALEQRKDGKLMFPLGGERNLWKRFNGHLAKKLMKKEHELSQADYQPAIKGILGMMRFANHENPLLLEALGDLLSRGNQEVPKQLAARVYLKASYVVSDPAAQASYRQLAESALALQTRKGTDQLPLATVEEEFAEELRDADAWYAELRGKEVAWIREGKDVEAEFDRLYAADPVAISLEQDLTLQAGRDFSDVGPDGRIAWLVWTSIAAIGLLLLFSIVYVAWRSRTNAAESPR